MQNTWFDLFDKRLEVGDTVAVAFPSGSSAVHRIGKIVGFPTRYVAGPYNRQTRLQDPGYDEILVEIEWDTELSQWAPAKSKMQNSDKYRFIKL